MDDLMARACPLCGEAFFDHSVLRLAEELDQAFNEEPPQWREIQDVRGETLSALLGGR